MSVQSLGDIKKALVSYVLVYQKLKRKVPTYWILDTLKYNTLPYDITKVNSRDI